MKTALVLFISAAFLVSAITCDSCSDSYNFADTSITSLKDNFFNNMFEMMFEDFENVMKSAELIQDSCSNYMDFSIDVNQFYTCSLAYSMLTTLLENYRFESESGMVMVLGQLVSLIPTIEAKFCLEEWEVTTAQNQRAFDTDIWDDDSTDDFSYEPSDSDLIEDEEDDDTGDEIYGDSDDEIINSEVAQETEEKIVTIDWSVMPQNSDSDDDEEEDEEEAIIGDVDDSEEQIQDDSLMVFVATPEVHQDDEAVIIIDNTREADIFIESEDHTPMPLEALSEIDQNGEDMIQVFVDMTNMGDTASELELKFNMGEESLSVYVDMNGELFLEDNKENSLFVFVDAETSADVDQILGAIFADNNDDDDSEGAIGELDFNQYWGDDEEESSDDY